MWWIGHLSKGEPTSPVAWWAVTETWEFWATACHCNNDMQFNGCQAGRQSSHAAFMRIINVLNSLFFRTSESLQVGREIKVWGDEAQSVSGCQCSWEIYPPAIKHSSILTIFSLLHQSGLSGTHVKLLFLLVRIQPLRKKPASVLEELHISLTNMCLWAFEMIY